MVRMAEREGWVVQKGEVSFSHFYSCPRGNHHNARIHERPI
jgi:hypothetical protein